MNTNYVNRAAMLAWRRQFRKRRHLPVLFARIRNLAQKKTARCGRSFSLVNCAEYLCRAGMFVDLRKNASAVQRVIDNFANGGGVGIDIHSVACA